jgi:Protein of unknown function (DUF3617)
LKLTPASLTVLACATIAGIVVFAAEPLNMKLGQWETTTTMQVSGMPAIPPEALAQLTPQQRQMIEERMKSTQGKPTVSKHCVKQEDVDKALKFGTEDKDCTRTIVNSSSTMQEIKIECNRDGTKFGGKVRVDASNRENVKGTIQMNMGSGDGGRGMTMNGSFTSKWLGATCEK